jgi:hypothetical protein
MTEIIANATWSRLPMAGTFIAGGWQDTQGRKLSAIVGGSRGDWSYLVQRADEANRKVEIIAKGNASTKDAAMHDAIETVRGYFVLAPYGRGESPQ